MEPVAICLICDDMRMESNGKPFIIGLYTHVMVFTELPATAPQMVFLVSVLSDITKPITKFTVNITGPTFDISQDFDLGPVGESLIPDAARAEAGVMIPIRPFAVSAPGVITVKVRYDGGEMIARRLPIQLVQQPVPIEPPAA